MRVVPSTSMINEELGMKKGCLHQNGLHQSLLSLIVKNQS